MKAMETRDKRKAETREKILAAGRELLLKEGFDAFSMRKLAAKVSYTATAIYVHFLHTNEATAMLPPGFRATGFLVLITGILEILGAIGLFIPLTRRSAALWIAIMMVLIFPVNINIAGQTFFSFSMPSVPVRLVAQIIYIWMVLLAGYGRPRFKRV